MHFICYQREYCADLYVIALQTTEAQLEELFAKYGRTKEVRVASKCPVLF